MAKEWNFMIFGFSVLLGIGLGIPGLLQADPVGPFVADFADTQDRGKFTLQVLPLAGIRLGDFDSGGTIRYAPGGDRDNSFALPIVGIYGITKDLEISADLTYFHNWKNQSGQTAQEGGIGDSFLKLKYRLFDGGEEGWQPSVSAIGRLRLPLGKYERLVPEKLGTDELGSGAYMLSLGLNVGKWTKKWQWTANLWYNWPLDTTIDGVQTRKGNFCIMPWPESTPFQKNGRCSSNFLVRNRERRKAITGCWKTPTPGYSMSPRVWAGTFRKNSSSWPAFPFRYGGRTIP